MSMSNFGLSVANLFLLIKFTTSVNIAIALLSIGSGTIFVVFATWHEKIELMCTM